MNKSLLPVITDAAKFCAIVEQSRDFEKEDFISQVLGLLPKIYLHFYEQLTIAIEDDYDAFSRSFVDEAHYNDVRNGIAVLMGEDDVFLDTFVEDMKYSDTPVAASISESLADIFQPLYDFVALVKETDGQQADFAYSECRELFKEYWSQILCNVLKALNNLHYK